MVRLLSLSLFSFIALSATAQITFEEGSWNQALQKAQTEKKLIFLDAYASWCGPCKQMAAKVFTDKTVGSFHNQKFVNVKIDMEKGEGLELAKKYGVVAYPTLLYIDANGEIMHRTCGSVPADTLIENGKTALDPLKRLEYYTNKYNSGSFDRPFFMRYIDMLDQACAPNISALVMTELEKVSDNDLVLAENWYLINEYLTQINSREFQYLLKNKDKFKTAKPGEIEAKIFSTFYNGATASLGRGAEPDEDAYVSYKNQIKFLEYSRSEEVFLKADITYYRRKGDWANYAATAEKYFTTYDVKDADLLNEAAWNVYEQLDDKTSITNALKWIEKSVKLDSKAANNDTYAALLLKAGRKTEALAIEKKALELAKAAGEDTTPYEDMLKKIEQSK